MTRRQTVDEADLTRRLGAMSLKEKVTLLTGGDAWTLTPVVAAGLASLALSDGPVGPRGTTFGDTAAPALLFPSPSSLAAAWDEDTAYEAGRLMGLKARAMGIHVLLAPTVNLHRSPLGGRHFECYSEDPHLTARTTVGFIKGVQSTGVAATVKHFIGNDSETERMTYDARIDEKTLRETYLPPFEAAVREAGAWVVMAAYNSVNGKSMTENGELLDGLLKEEWGFDGVVVSDWQATKSTEDSALAGLDVVMPGPDGPWGAALLSAVEEGRVPEAVIDDKVRRILRLAARVGALNGVEAAHTMEGNDSTAGAASVPKDVRSRIRDLAVRGSVLLRNDGLLPLRTDTLRKVALIGPNAVRFTAQGGGSAHVTPEHIVTPLEGLRRELGDDVEITVRQGVFPHATLLPLDGNTSTDPVTGEPGVRLEYRTADGTVVSDEHKDPASTWFPLLLADEVAELVVRTRLTLRESGVHRLSVLGPGHFTLQVPGDEPQTHEQLQDNDDIGSLVLYPPSHTFAFSADHGTTEIQVRFRPQRHLPHPITLLGLGYDTPRGTDDEELEAAVAAASDADAVVLMVGSDAHTESESVDRTTLALRGRQDELVERVCAANPRTAVVVNAGAPFLLPWADRPGALLWSWFPGQEGGDAIADILTGTEPGGRLPTTFPTTEADVPVLSTQPVDGTLDYTEGDLIGYRAYSASGTDPLFPFGHGLSYTTWDYEDLVITGDMERGLTVRVTIRNAGERRGREVVQAYLDPVGDEPRRLVGFAAVEASASASVIATITVPAQALTVWTPVGRTARSGPHRLRVGRSAADLRLTAAVPRP
ncbi:glycoside hydrolase family 3 C-terminal domain-containing protein [Streptomyces sp. MBT65]|uniref:glycoside hydrolase family 3 protein n=1 Tax=Streptomyces sp. MBT65 TaxID=1488395 RepID=UPI00190D59C0|nr:glycoside hydrolase family 3 C-terminal domain-containing protein [Streptomyces sp. MBT65]MBK3572677.1 glycoside hydrolase family 3 C-terminal domain-containing protein [Streptomyces sp. MBT65]